MRCIAVLYSKLFENSIAPHTTEYRYNKVESEFPCFFGELGDIKNVQKVRDQGGVAFLVIHSAMLGHPEPLVDHPNHWVSLIGKLVIDEDAENVKFNCYSWGETRLPKDKDDDPPDGVFPVNVSEGKFENHFWGYVTGKMS